MFDRVAWRREFYERYLLGLDDEEEQDEAEPDEEEQDYEPPLARLAQMADDIEADRVEPPHRWKLDRRGPDVQVWTTPSGRRYACDPSGELMPLPDGEAPFRAWAQ